MPSGLLHHGGNTMNSPSSIGRRRFLKSTFSAGAAWVAPQIVRAETLGNAKKAAANSRIGMGFIGMGLISDGHLRSFPGMRNVQPIAVCDVKSWQLEKAVGVLKEIGFNDSLATSRFEEVLAHPDVDAVCVTTPDHWHAGIALAAMLARQVLLGLAQPGLSLLLGLRHPRRFGGEGIMRHAQPLQRRRSGRDCTRVHNSVNAVAEKTAESPRSDVALRAEEHFARVHEQVSGSKRREMLTQHTVTLQMRPLRHMQRCPSHR